VTQVGRIVTALIVSGVTAWYKMRVSVLFTHTPPVSNY